MDRGAPSGEARHGDAEQHRRRNISGKREIPKDVHVVLRQINDETQQLKEYYEIVDKARPLSGFFPHKC